MPSARAIARRAGRLVMEMLRRGGPLPREMVTRKALENGAAIVAATGGSTNAALHLPALANEAGISFTLDDVGEVFARTPLIGNLRPGGKYTAKDVYDIGGTAVVIRALVESGHIDGGCLTITGRTIAEEYGEANAPDGEIIFSAESADHAGRRRGGAEGQSLPGWRRHQGGRSQEAWCSKAPRACSKTRKNASPPSAIAICRRRCSGHPQ
jgi:dihydroxyacid dehydratase/phosphogluconate dehydratase